MDPQQSEWWMESLEGALTSKEVLKLSDFDILELVGKGSFGMVLQVCKKNTGAIYALKVLDKKHITSKADTVRATKCERRVLEIVNHPFIVRLHVSVLQYC
jgi:serine/threonine protein kinase